MAQHWQQSMLNYFMQNKEQDRALQTPAEANRDKHMNYLAAEEQDAPNKENDENKDEVPGKNIRSNRDNSGATDNPANQVLQHENLIDPGNEHNHLRGPQTDWNENDNTAATGNNTGE